MANIIIPLWSNRRIEAWVFDQMEEHRMAQTDRQAFNPLVVPPTWEDVEQAMRKVRDDYERYLMGNIRTIQLLSDKFEQIKKLIDE